MHLLPVELLIDVDTGRGLAMVFSLLAAAIAWNLGTWYLGIPASSSHTLIGSSQNLTATTEYAPVWVVVAVALALGIGTMIGWRRIVFTVGEKIGNRGMTYAQGMSAQITAALAIGVANAFSLPVSTTHVLSSGVAGTMVANRSGLQRLTVRNIMLAWVLTLPVAVILSSGVYWLAYRGFLA